MKILAAAGLYTRYDSESLKELVPDGEIDLVVGLGNLPVDFYRVTTRLFPAVPRVAVLGDYDPPLLPVYLKNKQFRHLHLQTLTVNEMVVAGFSGSLRYRSGDFAWTQDEATALIRRLPAADILVASSLPHSLDSAGLTGLDDYVTRHSPALLLCSQHVFAANSEWQVGQTRIEVIFGVQVIELSPAILAKAEPEKLNHP